MLANAVHAAEGERAALKMLTAIMISVWIWTSQPPSSCGEAPLPPTCPPPPLLCFFELYFPSCNPSYVSRLLPFFKRLGSSIPPSHLNAPLHLVDYLMYLHTRGGLTCLFLLLGFPRLPRRPPDIATAGTYYSRPREQVPRRQESPPLLSTSTTIIENTNRQETETATAPLPPRRCSK